MRTRSIIAFSVLGCFGALVACSSTDDPRQGAESGEQVGEAAQAILPCDLNAPFAAPVRAFKTATSAGLQGEYDGMSLSSDSKTLYLSGRHLAGTSFDIMKVTRAQTSDDFNEANVTVLTPTGGDSNVTTTGFDDHGPSVTGAGAGTTMYLYKRNGSTLGDDIFQSTDFVNVTKVSAASSAYHDVDPYWVSGLSQLFFASQRDGDHTQRDLYRLLNTTVVKLPNPSGTPTPPAINTEYEETHPVVTSDGLTLFFASGRPGGIGGDFQDGDIYMATRATTSVGFSNVTNLWALNSSGRDFPVAVSADKCTLYFASNEYTGLGSTEATNLFQATRGTSTPPSVTMTLDLVGTGSVTQGGFNCSHVGPNHGGSTGTCAVSAAPNTITNVTIPGNALWQGSCTGNNNNPGSTGVLTWADNSSCTVTFQ